MTGADPGEVLAVRYCNRTTTRAENFLNHHLYGEPNTDIVIDYYFWVIRDGSGRPRRHFWTSPMARRTQFVTHAEADEIAYLQRADAEGRLTLIKGQHTLADGIELIEVGGHTPGQVVVSVATAAGPVVLASDAVHFYEEVERDRPFAIVADLPAMYRAYDLLAGLAAQPGARLIAGHDPLVRTRFAQHPANPEVTDLAGHQTPATGSP